MVQGSIRRQAPSFRAVLIPLRNFQGGLNLRDSATELAAEESPDLWNVTLDERGAVIKRLGFVKHNVSPVGAILTQAYESKATGKTLWYSQSDGKLYAEPGTGVMTLAKTFTAGSRIGIVDFAGKAYAIHPADGLYSSPNGTTWTGVTASAGTIPSNCDILANWQNKLWAAGNGVRVYYSTAGDPTDWASGAPHGGGSNDIREKDDAQVLALHGASGFDQTGEPSLLVGKDKSLYRISDSTTGAYVTLDASVGPAGAKCMVSGLGVVFVLSRQGIYYTSGFNPCTPLSDRLDPLFTENGLAYNKADHFCAGATRDVIRFSLTRAGSASNDIALEFRPFQFSPLAGGFVAGSNAAECYVTPSVNVMLGASPTVTGQAYRFDVGGSDDGQPIQSWWTSHVFEPSGGFMARLQQVRVLARGEFTLSVLPDFSLTGRQKQIRVLGTGFTWDVDDWDDGFWGDPKPQAYQPWYVRQLGRAIQFRVDETSSLSSTGPPMLEAGGGRSIGAWALYSLLSDFTPLGLS